MGIGNTVSEVTEDVLEVSTFYRKNYVQNVTSGRYWNINNWRSDVPTEDHTFLVIEHIKKTVIKPEFVGKVKVAINRNGILHNEDGPAVREIDISNDMVIREEYWINGKQYTKREFSNILFVKKMEILDI